MLKIAALLWVMIGTVFAGAGVIFVLSSPAMAGNEMKMIPIAALCGVLLAIPVSFGIAKAIGSPQRG